MLLILTHTFQYLRNVFNQNNDSQLSLQQNKGNSGEGGDTKPKKMAKENGTAGIKAHEDAILQHANAKKKDRDRGALRGRVIDFDEEFTPPKYPKTPTEVDFLTKALGSNFIFSDLTEGERSLLIDAMQKETADEDKVIIKQGDNGDFFYIVQEGKMNFVVDGNAVGACGAGGSFGELSLLYDSPRAATCVAGEALVLWKVDQGTFRHLLARSNKEEAGNITETLSKIDLFKDLDQQTVNKFADVLTVVSYKTGEMIVEKGQTGDVFYIVKDGQVRVHDIGLGDSSYEDETHGAGYWFGERALMTGNPRAASVTAMNEVEVFACDRETFETTIGPLETILGDASRKRFIKSVPIFSKSLLTNVEFDQLASMLKVRKYEKGQKLSEAGKVGDNPSLWIVKEGKLMITGKDGKIFFLGSSDYFGDKAVQADGEYVSNETCIVEEDTVCWRLKKTDIESVIGDVNRLGKPIPFVPKAFDNTLTIKDIKRHKMLGMGTFIYIFMFFICSIVRSFALLCCAINKNCVVYFSSTLPPVRFFLVSHIIFYCCFYYCFSIGAFGKVWLATSRDTNHPYALKTIQKRQLIEAGQIKGVMREKQIMASIEHPFILPLVGSFQDVDSLYLLLPFNQGGELFNVVHTDQRDGLDNVASQFYGGCILEALGYLHARNIVYRDMKPENALIDKDGYCIMIDFGFAKIVVDKTYTLCGTPEYLAPEIIMSKGHDKAVDYWYVICVIVCLCVRVVSFVMYMCMCNTILSLRRCHTHNY